MKILRQYADRFLECCADRYGTEPTPLFADGIDRVSGEPLHWLQDGRPMIVSNFARQQIVMQTLVGLSTLTGDDRYASAARKATAFMFEPMQQPGGLLPWGTHLFVDLNDKQVHEIGKGRNHELHGWFPWFEFFREVNPAGTERLVKGMWNAHVKDWRTLVFNRHGSIDALTDFTTVWDHPFDHPEPLIESPMNLTFIDCGAHLVDAAARLFMQNGDRKPLQWARRLSDLYRAARHPKTKLGAYQFTTPAAVKPLPPIEARPDGMMTTSNYGDRARNAFGADFGEIAREANLLCAEEVLAIYGVTATALLRLGNALGAEGKTWIEEQVEGLKAYAQYAYMPETNQCRPLWSDGTDLTGYVPEWPGYYRHRPDRASGKFMPFHVDQNMFGGFTGKGRYLTGMQVIFAYCVAYRYSGDLEIWNVARHMLRGNHLGDIGRAPGDGVDLTDTPPTDHPLLLLAMLELYEETGIPAYLKLANLIGSNIAGGFQDGYLTIPETTKADFCRVEPFALLRLEAANRGIPEKISSFTAFSGMVYNGNTLWP